MKTTRLGGLCVALALLSLVGDQLGGMVAAWHAGQSWATGLPLTLPPNSGALAGALANAEAAMRPLALGWSALMLVATVALFTIGVALRRELPWATAAARLWATFALGLVALRLALTALFVSRLHTALGPLEGAPALAGTASARSQFLSASLWMVLYGAFPVLLLLACSRRAPRA